MLLLSGSEENSILQVDYANVLRARGLPLREAIVQIVPHPAASDSDDDDTQSSPD